MFPRRRLSSILITVIGGVLVISYIINILANEDILNGHVQAPRHLSHQNEDTGLKYKPRPSDSLKDSKDYPEVPGDHEEQNLNIKDEDDERDEQESEDEEENDEDETDDEKEEEKETTNKKSQPVIPDIHKSRLLILAYMRTGSSMTGKILQSSSQVFYWYEPLHQLERYYVTEGHPDSPYRNTTRNEMFKESHMAGGNISATLSCDISQIYKRTLTNFFMKYGQKGTKFFHECFIAAKQPSMWRKCAENMTKICRSKYPVTAAKSIRLHMARARDVMLYDPKVKVIHLIRDPRGVLLSRFKLGYADFKKLKEEAKLLCQKYGEDLDLAPKKDDPLRQRYMLVRYEDIAYKPLQYTHDLYKFMGISPSKAVLSSVAKMMKSAKQTKKCPTCPPTPANSTEVSQAWRLTLTLEEVNVISSQCSKVLEMLGYRESFQTVEQLRDLSVSVVGPVNLR